MELTDSAPIFWLKGHKTILRPLEEADLETIYHGMNTPDTWMYLGNTWPKSLEMQKEWLKSKQRIPINDLTVAVCDHGGLMIGTMGLHQIDWISRTAETGTAIYSEAHRGQGYGHDAKMMLLYYAFHQLNLQLVTSCAIGFNERSVNYSQKCGYKVEGRLRQRIYRNGVYYDKIMLSVTYDEWLPLWEKFRQGL